MPKIYNPQINVYEAAKERLRGHHQAGDRLVFSISGGKDSTVCMELGVEVAREFNALPIDVIMRDEEIMVPGTFEYLERIHHQRPHEVTLHWVIAGQPIVNAFDRWMPYWWVFDETKKDVWVREPPPQAIFIDDQMITGMVTTARFPPPDGGRLIAVTGLRAQESLRRLSRIAVTRGALTKNPTPFGAWTLAPIYDWKDEDVWTAIKQFEWDYNQAYNLLYRIGVEKRNLRIAPPSMTEGLKQLRYLPKLWPEWFDRVAKRLPGIRSAAYYGKRAMVPLLKHDETWEQRFFRIFDEANEQGASWLIKRLELGLKDIQRHDRHSTSPYPQTITRSCKQCEPATPGSWEKAAKAMWNGDPFSTKFNHVPPLEPNELREGAKQWYDGHRPVGPLSW